MLNIWLQTRNGFGLDLQVVDAFPITLPIDLEIEGEEELRNVAGVFILSGYVIRLPFLNIFIGSIDE